MKYCMHCLIISTKLVRIDPMGFICSRCGKNWVISEETLRTTKRQLEKAITLLEKHIKDGLPR